MDDREGEGVSGNMSGGVLEAGEECIYETERHTSAVIYRIRVVINKQASHNTQRIGYIYSY